MMSILLSEKEITELGQNIWNKRKTRWLYEYEIFLILCIPQTLGIPITSFLDEKPEDGDAFLFFTNHDVKDDFYDWKRKRPLEKRKEKRKNDQEPLEDIRTALQESHDHILINQEKKIQAIYIKTASNEFFKRRIYKLDNRRTHYYQLSHYRNDQGDLIAANKGKFVDPKVGYLVYTYLIRPDLFVKDLMTLPPNYAPTIGWQIPASAISPNLSRSQLTTTDPEVDEK